MGASWIHGQPKPSPALDGEIATQFTATKNATGLVAGGSSTAKERVVSARGHECPALCHARSPPATQDEMLSLQSFLRKGVSLGYVELN